jgi:hypothetical protein
VYLEKAKHIHKRQAHPLSEKMIHKDYDSKVSVEKKTLVVSLKEFGTKTD